MSKQMNFVPLSAKENLKPLYMPDCIYLTEQCKCAVLQVSECIGQGCSFCKSSMDHRQSCGKWYRQMNNLSSEKQAKIAQAYYDGAMPWTDPDEKR